MQEYDAAAKEACEAHVDTGLEAIEQEGQR